MAQLQEWIHRLEVGGGARHLRWITAILAFVVLAGLYTWLEFRFLELPAAMDSAQVARNLARGRGFSTQFIRPFSIHLLEQQAAKSSATADSGRLRSPHPELAQPPVYPLLLAGAMKILPFDPQIPAGRPFVRYQPDLLIAACNHVVFLGLLVGLFLLARGLFDEQVAWVSALLAAGSTSLWGFSVSGLPTLLLTLLFSGVAACLWQIERRARLEPGRAAPLVSLGAALGLLLGLGMLTRYTFGWLMVPALLFLGLFLARHRVWIMSATLIPFLLLVSPWLARNYQLSGHLFGIAGYAAVSDTLTIDGERLHRSLGDPQLPESILREVARKAVVNGRVVLGTDLPRLGGSWIAAFFVAGLLLPFSDPSRSRLRWFLLWSLLLLVVVECVVRTPGVDAGGNDLLVWCAPLLFVFGVSIFFTLLDQVELVYPQAKAGVIGLLLAICWLPLVLTLLPPRPRAEGTPVSYPPLVQRVAGWVAPDALIMSDVPWAVAWFGDRQCVWNTLEVTSPQGNDFYAIHDLRKPVHGLYLSRQTLDQPLFSQLFRSRDSSWEHFAMESLVRTNIPAGFPLKNSPQGFLHGGGQLFLSDQILWQGR